MAELIVTTPGRTRLRRLRRTRALRNLVAETRPGTRLALTVVRGGGEHVVEATIGERPERPA